MIKKEIAEIKKQLTPERSTIGRMRGCYVNGDKEKVARASETFGALPQEEIFKYLDLFRKVLSGSLGKNLINMEFPLAAENPGGPHEELMKLRASELKDDMLLEDFYDRVITSYPNNENYLILLVYAAYDIPGKSSDNLEMIDASDEVFQHLICCICPVSLTKPGLGFDTVSGEFHNRVQDWVVEMPQSGFLFPAFHDRSTDIHSILCYTKKPEELPCDFIQDLFGCIPPLTAGIQKETFQTVIEESLGEDADFTVVTQIQTRLTELLEETKEEPEPLIIGKQQVREILEEGGADKDALETFDVIYDQAAGDETEFQVSNIVNARRFEVKTPAVSIKVAPENAALIETREIDGRKCLVIPIEDGLEVNGIPVKA